MVLFGGASGNPDPIDPSMLGKGSHFLTFASHFAYTSDPALYHKMATDLFQLVADRKIDFGSVEKIPLASAKESHDKLESRKAAGKILLVP
jgi:NADPH2:quinone reductase